MKKFFSLFLAIPMLAMLASCDDDDNENKIPDVSVSIEYSDATMVDGVLTVEQGTDLVIDALKVTPAPGTGDATLGNTFFYLDGVPFFATGVAPFGCTVPTSNLAEGQHVLSVRTQILQVGKSMAFGAFRYTLNVVPATSDPSDPSDPDSGSNSGSDTPSLVITEGTAE